MDFILERARARELILEQGRAQKHYWRDIWAYRELFLVLAWRDIAVRYKQMVIGVAWAIVRPFLMMVILTVVFGRLAKLHSEGGAPYPVMVFAGLLPWFLFSTILTGGSDSLVSNTNLIAKVYFPRIIIPTATVAVAGVDCLLNLAIVAALMAWYHYMPTIRVLLLPCFMALTILASLGPVLLTSALNVKYRDFRFVIPFIVQIGLYVSPVGFSSGVVHGHWRFLYSLNPLVGIIDGFRWCLLGGNTSLDLADVISGSCVTALFLWLGIAYFRRTERNFADLI